MNIIANINTDTDTYVRASDTDTDTYVRASDFADHIGGVHFSSEVWAVFSQCDTPRTPDEIACRIRLNTNDVHSALRRLSSKRLIRKNEIDWQTYLASLSNPPATAAPIKAPAIANPVPNQALVAAAPTPIAPPPAAIQPVPQTLQAAAPAPIPPAPQSLEFTLMNTCAAIARRQSIRDVLSFYVGKPTTAELVW